MNIDFDKLERLIENKKLPEIGKGTSRKVYSFGKKFVVKIAYNSKGLAQNQAEYGIIVNINSTLSIFFNPILAISSNYKYIVCRKAERVFRNSSQVTKFIEYPILGQISKIFNLCFGDINRGNSWGLIDGNCKLLDYGCTHEVFEKYYKRNR